jgi:hypothetical protein
MAWIIADVVVAGAVYSPLELISPFGPAVPLGTQLLNAPPAPPWQTCQDTAKFAVPVTVTLNWKVSVSPTVAPAGVIFTRMPESTCTVIWPNLFLSTQLVARI